MSKKSHVGKFGHLLLIAFTYLFLWVPIIVLLVHPRAEALPERAAVGLGHGDAVEEDTEGHALETPNIDPCFAGPMPNVVQTGDSLESLRLEDGGAAVTLAPSRGGMVTRFSIGEVPVLFLDESTLRDPSKNVRGGIPVLFPIAGKLPADRYEVDGRTFTQAPMNPTSSSQA